MDLEFVDVMVTGPDGRIVKDQRRVKLPATIGRSATADVHIPDAPPDMSRVHVELSLDREGRVLLRDTSTHGTRHLGKTLLNGDSALLSDEDSFEIRGYKLAVKRMKVEPHAADILAAVVDSHGTTLAVYPLGELCLVCLSIDGNFRFEVIPANAEFDKLFGQYRLNEKRPLFAVVASEGAILLLTDREGREAGVRRNRVPVEDGQVTLEALDLIEVGKVRIELSIPGQQYQVCVNPTCERLNPYNPHVNCRHCGTKLQEARTRALRAGNARGA